MPGVNFIPSYVEIPIDFSVGYPEEDLELYEDSEEDWFKQHLRVLRSSRSRDMFHDWESEHPPTTLDAGGMTRYIGKRYASRQIAVYSKASRSAKELVEQLDLGTLGDLDPDEFEEKYGHRVEVRLGRKKLASLKIQSAMDLFQTQWQDIIPQMIELVDVDLERLAKATGVEDEGLVEYYYRYRGLGVILGLMEKRGIDIHNVRRYIRKTRYHDMMVEALADFSRRNIESLANSA